MTPSSKIEVKEIFVLPENRWEKYWCEWPSNVRKFGLESDIPEDRTLHSYHRENLKISYFISVSDKSAYIATSGRVSPFAMQITFYPQIYIQLPPLVLFCRNEGI
jgi:hypothetical protein